MTLKTLKDEIRRQGVESQVRELAQEITQSRKSKAQQGQLFWTKLPGLLKSSSKFPSWTYYDSTGKIDWSKLVQEYAK